MKPAKRLILGLLLTFSLALPAGTVLFTYDGAGRLIKTDYGGGKSIAYTYDANGNLLSRVTVAGPVIPGDCNGDGVVSIGEVQKAINMFLGTEPVGCGVDCDGDGSVSIGEVQRVINGFLGFETSCPVTCTLACAASASPPSGTAPLTVSFTSTVTATGCSGSPSYQWSFGDGGASGLQNPDHTYAQAGTYAWSVTVTQDGQSCTENGTATVNAVIEEITVDLPGGVTMVLVKIPAGTFQMGSTSAERGSEPDEYPVHTVTISQAFYMGKTVVTQAQWEAVMGIPMPDCGSYGLGSDYPVRCVSWNDITKPDDANSFLKKLDAHLSDTGQPGAGTFRLPSEAEWEYAARAGTATRFSYGDVLECGDLCEACATHDQYMWWCSNAGATSHPVGALLPNPFGLYDMHGNVRELCQDWWGAYSGTAQTDPTGPLTGSLRVNRGAGFWGTARSNRSAARQGILPTNRDWDIGFRLVRSVGP